VVRFKEKILTSAIAICQKKNRTKKQWDKPQEEKQQRYQNKGRSVKIKKIEVT